MTTRTLTPTEQALVDRSRKNPRPVYYSAALDDNVGISYAMETWLILTPLATRARFSTWLQQLAQLTVRDANQDALLAEYLADEASNAQALNTATTAIFQPYDQFRDSILVAGFEDVPELYTLFQQSTKGLGRITEIRDDARFNFALSNDLTKRFEATQGGAVTQASSLRELRSWVPVLLAYAGV